jgi:hypothetical protein
MKFFIDTADIAEIRDLAATGLVDGITTNPSLVAKSGRDFFEVLKEICEVVPGPVSAEVTATDSYQRFSQVNAKPEFKELTSRPEFQTTFDLLREYNDALNANPAILPLPAPPK